MPVTHRSSTPTTGWPTCATRSGSATRSPPPAPPTATFIEISPHPLLTKAISDTLDDPDTGNKHHHSLGTLQRDTHDTVAFHTHLNATFTARPPVGEHPPEPHPALPTTPWRHTRHWLDFTPALSTNGFGARRGSRKPLARRGQPRPGGLAVRTDLAESGRCPTAPPVAPPRGWCSATTSWPPNWAAVHVGSRGQRALRAGAGRRRRSTSHRPTRCSTRPGVSSTELTALPSPPKLFFLTRNAQPVVDGDRANPVHAVLWGLGRTLALEHPEIWGGVIDVDESMPAVLTARHVRRRGDRPATVRTRSSTGPVPGTCRVWSRRPRRHRMPCSAKDSSHLVIGATGHIGPHLIQQLADMGAGTIVAVSRNPGEKLKELGRQLASSGHDAGRGGRRRHRRDRHDARCSTGSAPIYPRSRASTSRPSPVAR